MRARLRANHAWQMTPGGLLLGAAVAASAQEIVRLEKVTVTGTNIPRIESETGLPLQVITRDELLQGGVQTVQDLLVPYTSPYVTENPTLNHIREC